MFVPVMIIKVSLGRGGPKKRGDEPFVSETTTEFGLFGREGEEEGQVGEGETFVRRDKI